ncbi:hypothetical protein KSP39_PZI009410 [Platanthera zijinensis]|uniref:tetraacyldisaccharide 4'-kinase n=1 Tax=Platanthera zijinensis TaxID=2320716 RepID=A0AAP0G7T0_9ASPA
MVEYIARYLDELGIPSLILSRGYAGGDEAKMLERHLLHTSVKIGVGANRNATAAAMFERYGFMDLSSRLYSGSLSSPCKLWSCRRTQKIGVVILDDGMQHWSLFRNVEVVMINGLSPWGNKHLIPRGSLREPLESLCRAHIGVIHHADLVPSAGLNDIVLMIRKNNPSLLIFFSRLAPLFVFDVKRPHSELPLTMVINIVILCISAIGFPDAFVQRIKEIGPLHVDRLNFSDHYSIKPNDINMIRKKLTLLQRRFGLKPIVIVTEKDYDRDPAILREVDDFQVIVLCSSLQILPFEDRTEDDFRTNIKNLLLSSQKCLL